jgi:hypothetical protein
LPIGSGDAFSDAVEPQMPGIVLVILILTLSPHFPGTKELYQEVYYEKDDFSGVIYLVL